MTQKEGVRPCLRGGDEKLGDIIWWRDLGWVSPLDKGLKMR
jgi:hypothetical protein